MSARAEQNLPEEVHAEIALLHRAGFHLLPLGGGDDGKKPILRGWADKCPDLAQVLGPMHGKGVAMYGIRLDGLAVVDCDTDDPNLVANLEARFGPSPVHVKTPRGLHLYYQFEGKPPNLRGEGLEVDIKAGPRAYVVGPFSIRPDGRVYRPIKGMLGVDILPPLEVLSFAPVAPVNSSDAIQEGSRHTALVKLARQWVPDVSNREDLKRKLQQFRDHRCESPHTMQDSELEGIAAWAWQLRLENRLYTGRASSFSLDRMALDLLSGKPAQEDALALYVRLVDQHGHIPGATFPLSHEAMKKAGLTSLSRERFLAARRTLQEVGLLELIGKHQVGKKRQTFALNMPLDPCENVKKLAP